MKPAGYGRSRFRSGRNPALGRPAARVQGGRRAQVPRGDVGADADGSVRSDRRRRRRRGGVEGGVETGSRKLRPDRDARTTTIGGGRLRARGVQNARRPHRRGARRGRRRHPARALVAPHRRVHPPPGRRKRPDNFAAVQSHAKRVGHARRAQLGGAPGQRQAGAHAVARQLREGGETVDATLASRPTPRSSGLLTSALKTATRSTSRSAPQNPTPRRPARSETSRPTRSCTPIARGCTRRTRTRRGARPAYLTQSNEPAYKTATNYHPAGDGPHKPRTHRTNAFGLNASIGGTTRPGDIHARTRERGRPQRPSRRKSVGGGGRRAKASWREPRARRTRADPAGVRVVPRDAGVTLRWKIGNGREHGRRGRRDDDRGLNAARDEELRSAARENRVASTSRGEGTLRSAPRRRRVRAARLRPRAPSGSTDQRHRGGWVRLGARRRAR